MLPRFFAPEANRNAGPSGAEPIVSLPEDESAHVRRVLRLAVGDSIRVFDGEGGEWRAEIAEVTRRRVAVRLREPVAPAREPRIPIVLAVAVLKADRMDDVVRDAVMMGVAAIQPLVTTRTEIGLPALARGKRVERWQRIAIASCKQCGRAVVPPVCAAQAFDAWLALPAGGARLLLAEPGAAAGARPVQDVAAPSSAEAIVGPEGGWTEGELSDAKAAGAEFVTLGGVTLRADAVPLVALTALRTVWRDL